MSEVRVPYFLGQPLHEGYSDVRVTVTFTQPLHEGFPSVRSNVQFAQPLHEGYPTVRVPLMVCQALFPVLPELNVSTDPFPGFGNSTTTPSIPAGRDPFNTPLPGLSYGIKKKPMFKTKISEGVAGNEVRSSLTEYPRWDFEFSYEFLEDSTGANSSLKYIMGFFLQRRGSFDSFLVKDPDDYLVQGGWLGDSDGTITQFPFLRNLGGFNELVGQIDTANTISIYHEIAEGATIPATPGPYTVTVTHAAAFSSDVKVMNGLTQMTKVASAPAAGEYSVSAGVYTFNSADQGDPITITYRYLVDPADYTFRMPNYLVFDAAPASGAVYADFQFFFACRFVEDQMDFEKFYDELWNLQSCKFRSIIQ